MAEYIEHEAVSADGCGKVRKIKTPFARIIVGGTADKPYYHILWWDTAKKECYIGYSSYYLEYVFKWLKEEFEITEKDADVAPVVHGRWEDVYGGKYQNKRYRCTVCKEKALFKFYQDELLSWHDEQKLSNYCPNCGARMDGE